jgi:hypothetical protein
MDTSSKSAQFFIVTGAFLGWFSVVLQFYLIIINREASVPETIIRYFSFFTILTNLLITVCFTVLLCNPLSSWGRFFSLPSTLTSLAVYIVIVGLVYNGILRFLWSPQGVQQFVDELLHFVNPLWFLLFWIFFVPKSRLKWKNVFFWLLYPLFYIIFILVRGSVSGFYPYPFVNVNNLGYPGVFVNCLVLFLGFLLISLLFVWIGKRWRK